MFPNLTKLKLQNNLISDLDLEIIGTLKHLEYLNLYGTKS